ncbi:unnamed protein product [Bubo scandiacus]
MGEVREECDLRWKRHQREAPRDAQLRTETRRRGGSGASGASGRGRRAPGAGRSGPAERSLGAGAACHGARPGLAAAAVPMETGPPPGRAPPAAFPEGRGPARRAGPGRGYWAGASGKHRGCTARRCAAGRPSELSMRRPCVLRPALSPGARCLSAPFLLRSALCVLPRGPKHYLRLP